MDNDVIDTLNDLIETSKDGEYGFRQSAEHAKAAELKTVLNQRADECRRGAEELQALVAQHGGKPEQGGSASGAMHRGWVSVRSAMTSKDDAAMLEECERGEDIALKSYRKAAAKTLPPDVKTVVERQLQGVQRNHDQIKALRDRYKSAT